MKETHKCKFNNESNLPTCPWKNNRCHSPCDLIAQSPNRPQAEMVISTPDGPYPSDQLTDSELYQLRNKRNKLGADWKTLHSAGWADRSYNDQDEPVYTLNEIGLAGGWKSYQQEAKQLRHKGIGPL